MLNRIAKREAAIVSPVAGTTWDVIEVHLDLDGYPVTLLDTAGIRDSADPVEQEGVRRARERASEADLVLWVYDAEEPPSRSRATTFAAPVVWYIQNKIDLMPPEVRAERKTDTEFKLSNIVFYLSAITGLGLAGFLTKLAAHAESYFGSELALLSRERHRKLLTEARTALDRVLGEGAKTEELVAEELRSASHALGRLTGRVQKLSKTFWM